MKNLFVKVSRKRTSALLVLLIALSANAQSFGLGAGRWHLWWDSAVPQPYNMPDGSLQFDFATHASGLWDGYLLEQTPGGLRNFTGKTVVVTGYVVATLGTVFRFDSEPANTCPDPSAARVILWSDNKKLEPTGDERWWASAFPHVLADGTFSLVIPVQPQYWSNVFGALGTEHPTQFASAIARVTWIGFTFGGGCFYGHGVNTDNGNATFTITDFRLQ